MEKDLVLFNLNEESIAQKYLRKDVDGGVLTDKDEIEIFAKEQFDSVIDNLMLGNYNAKGEYEIDKNIKQELIKCVKVVEDSYENILFLSTMDEVEGFGYIEFALKMVKNEPILDKTTVTLELLEPVFKANGYIENTQSTMLYKSVEITTENLKNDVFNKLNIKRYRRNDSTGAKKEIIDEEEEKSNFDKISLRKKQLIKVKTIYLKKNSKYEKAVLVRKKEILGNSKTGKKVLNEYTKALQEAGKYTGLTEKMAKQSNQLLNSVIEKNKTEFKKNEPEVLKEINKLEIEKNKAEIKETFTKEEKTVEIKPAVAVEDDSLILGQ